MKQWWLIAVCLALAACSQPFSTDETIARQELLKIAPVGSDIRTALPRIEVKGFECSWLRDRPLAGTAGTHDYLFCDNRKLVGTVAKSRWQLAVIHENHIVIDAQVRLNPPE